MESLGRKDDSGKLEYGLIHASSLEDIVRVLTFGSLKYGRENWRFVDDASRRYFDALQRHIWAWKKGEKNDPETGVSHLAHASCCLLFLLELDRSCK